MPITVHIKISKRFKVNCPIERAFALLADVPESASHFPKVDRLVDLGGNAYRWEMQKIGFDRYHIQTIYACRYKSNKRDKTVTWEPIEGEGNAVVRGKWTLKSVGKEATQCSLTTTGDLTVPLPSLAKFIVAPLVVGEFDSLADRYVVNLKKTLNS